jgi:hypothetical protein
MGGSGSAGNLQDLYSIVIRSLLRYKSAGIQSHVFASATSIVDDGSSSNPVSFFWPNLLVNVKLHSSAVALHAGLFKWSVVALYPSGCDLSPFPNRLFNA